MPKKTKTPLRPEIAILTPHPARRVCTCCGTHVPEARAIAFGWREWDGVQQGGGTQVVLCPTCLKYTREVLTLEVERQEYVATAGIDYFESDAWGKFTSLTSAHIKEIVHKGTEMADNTEHLSDKYIRAQIKEASKWMYTDDAPGLRGDSQMKVAVCEYALHLRTLRAEYLAQPTRRQ